MGQVVLGAGEEVKGHRNVALGGTRPHCGLSPTPNWPSPLPEGCDFLRPGLYGSPFLVEAQVLSTARLGAEVWGAAVLRDPQS